MKTYTYTEARKNLDAVLNAASGSGPVVIRRKNGLLFRVEAVPDKTSPLSCIQGVRSGISREELLACIREGREA